MSEVKKLVTRYSRDFSGNMQVDPNGSWVLAADASIHAKRLTDKLDAAQSDLAALREELATANGCLEEWRRSKLGQTITENMDLRKALAAAEQRNAQLVELLTEVSRQAGDHHMSHQTWNLKTQLANIHQKIEAALKPTESGASE